MKRKINLYLIGISVAVVLAATICMTAVFYALFQRQVTADLRINAEVLKDTGLFDQSLIDEDEGAFFEALQGNLAKEEDLRVTWIEEDGTVLYDNDTDAASLPNHADRPEVAEALEEGEGETVRRSDTMGKNTVYYALLLEDGSVLRLSTDVSNVLSIFASIIPVLVLIVLVIILISAVVARVLTGQLLAPINNIAQDMENLNGTPVYEELVPFVDTIRTQHEDILSAAQARQDFTANVSHELKTPLTAISGYAELIENGMADPAQTAEFAGQIRQNSDRLLSLIDDTIRLSELDSSSPDLMTFEEMDLFETASESVELLSVTAEKKGVNLSLKGSAAPMRGNKAMITELINNLIQNAIYYNKENGSVTVTVKTEQERPVLTVADTGIGIPKEMQDRVFERFFRVDKSRSRETGGTGLGLAIVKHIAELHNAEISLESTLGEGTVVTVIF